jgi:hypothetical protein
MHTLTRAHTMYAGEPAPLQQQQQQQQQQAPRSLDSFPASLAAADEEGEVSVPMLSVDRGAIENFLRPPPEELPDELEVRHISDNSDSAFGHCSGAMQCTV